MRSFDFSSWQSVLTTLIGIALFALVGIGIRILFMVTLQQRRERMNRQINERLKVLIAAYKVLGGSFTGNLAVDPRHLRDLAPDAESPGSDRSRRIRDAVEGALSDILLLGTEEQVELAAAAARDLAAGRPVPTQPLVASLRAFIRSALDLTPIPAGVAIPAQGPTRPGGGSGGKGGGGREGGGRGGGGGQGGAGGGGMAMGMGLGAGAGAGLGAAADPSDDPPATGAG
ncbi:hypothetical protein [Tabrizicola sp.]|uniref:hypothetical protein n=1 Tax=Tabrizicola sp. TaxID=2005166 RepID=UPI001A4CE4A7|nr:hypothetical protein [Tabrizicola sp.]MBL9073242.1 hypothetical protein [Tabrizicola sp.]